MRLEKCGGLSVMAILLVGSSVEEWAAFFPSLEEYIRREKLEPISERLESGQMLPAADVITHHVSLMSK